MRVLRTPRIVFVNNFLGPGMGGGEVLLMHVIRACVAEGWDVAVVCPPRTALASRAGDAGAEVIECGMAPARVGTLLACVRRLATRADIVEGTGYFTDIVSRIATRGMACRVVSLVAVAPAAYRSAGGSPLTWRLRRLVDAATRTQVAAYIAVSNVIGEGLVRGGVPAERVRVIRNSVDLAGLRHDAAASALPAAIPAGTGPFVGCVGRLEHVKGIDVFIDAAATIAENDHAARFVIAGSGTQEAVLRHRVPAHLRERVSFLGTVTSIAPLLAALDVLVLPSRSEGLPTVLLEAGALGVPVVATAVGGTPEAVVDGETGILVPPSEPRAIADAVLGLLREPERARAMGAAAQERIGREFSVEKMQRDTLAVYGQLLGMRPPL